MAKGTPRVCCICNTEYKYCPSCDKKMPTWSTMFDTENCKNIFYILTDYNFGKLTKEETVSKLEECDLSQKSTFRRKIQDEIDSLMAKPKHRGYRAKLSLVDEVMEAPVVEEAPVAEIIEEELPLA